MTADLRSRLSAAVLQKIGGTDLEYDIEGLEQLARIVPDEQATVVHRLRLGIAWETALAGMTLRPPEESTDTPDAGPKPALASPRSHERWPIEKLKPNRFNASLFPDSLSEASIAQMAEDLARNGQRVPVEVMPTGEIIDGERRWRGAQHLGWAEMEVVVGQALSDDEVLDRVVDACTSSRQMSLREQVNVYTAVCERLKREAGRDVGRQDQLIPKGINYLTPRAIRDAAARRAGFSSTTLAVRADAVFSRGSDEVQAKLRDRSLTISAAYEAVQKRPKAGTSNDELVAGDAPGGPDESGGEEPEQPADSDPSAGDQQEDGASDSENNDDGDDHEAESDSEESSADTDLAVSGGEEEVSDHVSAICGHVTRLAEHDYDEALFWIDDVYDQMKASLGERPEDDGQEFTDGDVT